MTEESLFLAALDYLDPADRAAFLRRACPDDEALLRRVEALLDAHDRPGDLPMIDNLPTSVDVSDLATVATQTNSTSGIEATGHAPTIARTEGHPDASLVRADEVVGSRIGPYTLTRLLGEGGMGVVFEAHQEKPVRRKVALKVIKAGMDTHQVVSRFGLERQSLAIMDHPGIARVLDAGATEAGRPFFVMELVEGEPITEYCDRHRLSTRRRIELLIPVCLAVQHAHQKGIVHRDLKPSNVLVAEVEGKPVPKVIDFGIAKAIDAAETERTLFTQQGAIVGTPDYMSPEQAGGAVDVDTRSDIYAIGVLLYELLTGSTPLGRDNLRRGGYLEILRRVREEEPPRPSTRLSESGEHLDSISSARDVEPSRLSRLVRGELDWIAMRALEKDRSRRYGTAADFAADLRRHLDGHAVEAGPPSRRYRLGKFARRHRAGLATASAFTLMLIAATAFSAWQAVAADRARRDALAAKVQSDEDRARAEAVSDFLVATFRKPDPRQDGRDLKVVDLLDGTARELGPSFKGSVRARVALLVALGETYRGLGLYERAERVFADARRVAEANLGPNHPDTLKSRSSLARVYSNLGRLLEAIQLGESTLKAQESTLGFDHPETLMSRSNLAVAYSYSGRYTDALALHESTLKARERVLGPDHPDTLMSRNNVAVSYYKAGRVAEAFPLYESTLRDRERVLGPEHPDTLWSRSNLAAVYFEVGRKAEALALNESTLKVRERVLGPDHPDTVSSQEVLAYSYSEAGRKGEALPIYESIFKAAEARGGTGHPDAIRALLQLGLFHRSSSNFAVAIPIYERANEMASAKLKPDDPLTFMCRRQLDWTYLVGGQQDRALARLEESLARSRSNRGPDDPESIEDFHFLLSACLLAGKLDRAVELCRVTKPCNPPKQGRELAASASDRHHLGWALHVAGRSAEAVPLLRITAPEIEAQFGPDNPGVHTTFGALGCVELASGQAEAAIPSLERALRGREKNMGADHLYTLDSINELAEACLITHRWGQAEDLRRELRDRCRRQGPAHEEAFADASARLGRLLILVGKPAEAEAPIREALAIRDRVGRDGWSHFVARALLGASLLDQDKPTEAEPFLIPGLDGMAELRPRTHHFTLLFDELPDAADRVDRLYQALGQPEKAVDWRAKHPVPAGPREP